MLIASIAQKGNIGIYKMARTFVQAILCEASLRPLGLSYGFVGASAFAGAAVDALVGVDDVGGFTLGDGANGADICAGAAGDTKVGIDFSRHGNSYLNVVVFSFHKCRHYI